jgi:hypothetical protein
LSRSTFYARQKRALHPAAWQRRGPKTPHPDAGLLELIRQAIADSPFQGEGHRKIWARLRVQDVRTSKPRVLRLMRENQLLAPQRRLPVAPANVHEGDHRHREAQPDLGH